MNLPFALLPKATMSNLRSLLIGYILPLQDMIWKSFPKIYLHLGLAFAKLTTWL